MILDMLNYVITLRLRTHPKIKVLETSIFLACKLFALLNFIFMRKLESFLQTLRVLEILIYKSCSLLTNFEPRHSKLVCGRLHKDTNCVSIHKLVHSSFYQCYSTCSHATLYLSQRPSKLFCHLDKNMGDKIF